MSRFEKIRRNAPVNTRLLVLVGVMLLFIGIIGFYGIRGIVKVSDVSREINEKYLQRINQLSYLTENLYSIVVEGKNHILASDKQGKLKVKQRLENNIQKTDQLINEYGNKLNREQEVKLYKRFNEKYKRYKKINSEIITLSESGKQELALKLSNTTELKIFRDMQVIIQKMMSQNLQKANQKNELALDLRENTKQRIYIIIAVIVILSLLLSFGLINDISQSLKGLRANLNDLGKGKIPDTKLPEYKDEIGQMAFYSNKLIDKYSSLSSFLTELGKGNYNPEHETLGEEDVIGKSLIKLRDNLKKNRDEAQKREREDELRNWANKGLAKFAEILRERSGDIKELAGSIVKNTIQYVNASQGGIFIYNDEDPNNPYLELLAAYAYNKEKHLQKSFAPGEGLVGTCAVDKETIYIEEIPENYLEIHSGIGSTKPESLLIVPLKLQEDIFGVVEIASLKKMEKYEIDFIEELADNIASTLSAARLNERTRKLLEESKQKSDELSSQEEEMRQNLEEMRATQEQYQKKEIELNGMTEAIDNLYIKSEYDLNGNFLNANSNYLQMVGYHLDDLKGKNVRMFVPQDRVKKFEQIWENLKQGTPSSGIFNLTNRKNETTWVINSYTPVKDNYGEIFKILFLGADITNIKQETQEAQQKAHELENQLNEKTEEISQLKQEYENKQISYQNQLQTSDETIRTYEFELEEIHKKWMHHLDEAEKLYEQLQQQKETIDNKDKELTDTQNKLQKAEKELNTSLSRIKQLKEYPEMESEIWKRYNQWLKGLEEE